MDAKNDSITLDIAGAQVKIPAATLTELWLNQLRAASRVAAQVPDNAPRIGQPWQGGIYAGITIDQLVPAHLVLLPGEEKLVWKDALAWADREDASLPSRFDALTLFQNLKAEFKPEYYWTSEQRAAGSDYAWVQDFDWGGQDDDHKSIVYRARLVRRFVI